jgi:hypothetical protein
MKTYKRPLTARQATNCENAKKARCVCRCGGVLHGGSHRTYREFEAIAFDIVRRAEDGPVTEQMVVHLVRQAAGLPGLEAMVGP